MGSEPKESVTRVRLVKTTSITSQASKIVKAEIENIERKGEHCVFEPDTVVASSGLSIPETVLTIGKKRESVYPIAELIVVRKRNINILLPTTSTEFLKFCL